jgi:hypothetical protein
MFSRGIPQPEKDCPRIHGCLQCFAKKLSKDYPVNKYEAMRSFVQQARESSSGRNLVLPSEASGKSERVVRKEVRD